MDASNLVLKLLRMVVINLPELTVCSIGLIYAFTKMKSYRKPAGLSIAGLSFLLIVVLLQIVRRQQTPKC